MSTARASNLHSFQIWIGLASNTPSGQDITFTYGANTGNGDGGLATVGAENRFGNRGANYYYNGTGTLPTSTTELRVTGTPPTAGGKKVVTYTAKGEKLGAWVNYAELTSNTVRRNELRRGGRVRLRPEQELLPAFQVRNDNAVTQESGCFVGDCLRFSAESQRSAR